MLGLPPWERVLHRLRHDYALATVAALAGCGALGILPFAVYRFLSGQIVVGVIDVLVALSLLMPTWHALVTGNNRIAFVAMMVLAGIGAVAVSRFLGLAGHFWLFPLAVASYAVVGLRRALVIGFALIVLVLVFGTGIERMPDRLSFAATAALVVILAAISAYQVERQRCALELAAATDALTGVGNRRKMDADLRQAAELAARGSPLPAVLVLDIDHFKSINDRFGHEAGDRVLSEFAQLISHAVRQSDRVYRMGGEEFLVLLPMVDPNGLDVVAEKLRRCIEANLRWAGGTVTCSLGAALHQRGESVDAWVGRADKALYQAKQDGRNRFCIAPWSPDPRLQFGPERRAASSAQAPPSS